MCQLSTLFHDDETDVDDKADVGRVLRQQDTNRRLFQSTGSTLTPDFHCPFVLGMPAGKNPKVLGVKMCLSLILINSILITSFVVLPIGMLLLVD